VPTPHSGPYRSQDPDKPEEVVDAEAALAYARLRRRDKPEDICRDLGISRATFYRRIEKLMLRHDRPSRSLIEVMEHEHLDDLTAMVEDRLKGEVSNADFAKLVTVALSASRERRSLLLKDTPGIELERECDPEMVEWVAGADAEADAELKRVREDG